MANHELDSAVVERRLRPIYGKFTQKHHENFHFPFSPLTFFQFLFVSIDLDALEAGNTKKALHETEKVLKKAPNLQVGRALKGIALQRLGRIDESTVIIDQIMAEKSIETGTLTVLSYIFKEQEECECLLLLLYV